MSTLGKETLEAIRDSWARYFTLKELSRAAGIPDPRQGIDGWACHQQRQLLKHTKKRAREGKPGPGQATFPGPPPFASIFDLSGWFRDQVPDGAHTFEFNVSSAFTHSQSCQIHQQYHLSQNWR